MTDVHDPPADSYRYQDRPEAEHHAERRIALYWAVTTVAALVLAGVYLAGGQPQLEGLLLMIALGSLGLGFVVFARDLLPGNEQTAPRGDHHSSTADREAVDEAFERGEEPFVRRSFLLRMLGLAGGALGVAAMFPINSLGPHPGDTLAHTSWKKGSRLVTADGRPVQVEGPVGQRRAHRLSRGVDRRRRQPDDPHQRGRRPQKVRTGPGRVVGRRAMWPSPRCAPTPAARSGCTARPATSCCARATSRPSTCSTNAGPVFGPAARSLPQLALAVRDDGFLMAQHDYTEPVGPGYWNRP